MQTPKKAPDRLELDEIYNAPWQVPTFEERLDIQAKQDLRLRVKVLSRLKPMTLILHMLVDWAILCLTIYTTDKFLPIYIWPIALVIIACRQHALLVLMHDACHFTFLKNRKVADLIMDTFAAFPFFITTENFRFTHLQHHRFLNSDKDPDLNVKKLRCKDWEFPMRRSRIVIIFIREIFGGAFFDMLRKINRFAVKNTKAVGFKVRKTMPRLIYYFFCFGLINHFNLWREFSVFWLLPALFILPIFLRIRSLADHFGLEGTHELNQARNLVVPFWQQFIFAPHNIGVHIAHHLYPSVPYYNLKQLHRDLTKFAEYETIAHNTLSVPSGRPGGLFWDLQNVQTRLRME